MNKDIRLIKLLNKQAIYYGCLAHIIAVYSWQTEKCQVLLAWKDASIINANINPRPSSTNLWSFEDDFNYEYIVKSKFLSIYKFIKVVSFKEIQIL